MDRQRNRRGVASRTGNAVYGDGESSQGNGTIDFDRERAGRRRGIGVERGGGALGQARGGQRCIAGEAVEASYGNGAGRLAAARNVQGARG